MRLLAPQQTKDLKEAEVARELLRSKEAQEMARKIRLDMANSQADFNQMLADNRNKWAAEEQEHAERAREMDKEIYDLEARKSAALTPIESVKKEAEESLEKSKVVLAKAERREEEAEELNEQLQDKLDVLGQREQDVAKREQKALIQEQGIAQQTESIHQQNKQLSQRIQEFSAFKEEAEADIYERKKVLFLKERSLLAKEDTQKRTDKALSDLAIQLADERKTLDREIKRKDPS